MKAKKKFVWAASVVALLLVLTGCSQNQQEIFNSVMKMQDVKSLQEHTTMTFQLSGSGFEPDVQQQVEAAAMYLNNAKLELDVKTSGNEQKTATKSQVDMNLALQGTNINMPIWVDSDFTGETSKVTEIIKLPQIAKASLPPQFANKEYMIINPFAMNNSAPSNIDMTNFMKLSRNLQTMEVNFLTSYSQRFNPNFDVVDKGIQDVQTNDGLKSAHVYEINLNDAQFKEFIRYTVNNFVQDKEAMNFVKEFMHSILEISQVPDNAKSLNDFDQAFNEFDTNKTQFLTDFNTAMDQLNDVEFLGDKGLALKYAISDGYFVKESGAINLKLDFDKMNHFMNTLNGQQSTSVDANGTLNLMVTFSTDISGINSPLEIQIPEVNTSNSFSYLDLMNSVTNNARRLSGQDRYQTAKAISEKFNAGTVQDVIITSGNNFPDALSASVLAKKLNAPILLVDSQVQYSNEALDYISQHLSKTGTVHILGGAGVIGSEFETKLNQMGFLNLERIGGYDRYDTDVLIAQKLDVVKNTPVVIASGENFPDTLSISSIASSKGYPILLVSQDYMSQGVKDFITNDQPTQIYMVGGTGAISETIQSQIQALVPNCPITRLAGQDRFDTAGEILNMFYLNPKTIYIASGNNFPDALAGSVLVSANGDPILLIDPSTPNVPPAIEAYLKKLHDSNIRPAVTCLGGTAVVPDAVMKKVESILYLNP